MKIKIFVRITITLFILIFASIIATLLLSPYKKQKGFNYRCVQSTVEINASADSVFKFLGNSGNATRWSVFVDHISPLNSNEVDDGKVGSMRRCYCNKDETGTQWDELTTIVEPSKRRQLTMSNLNGFPLTCDNLATEQLYTPKGNNKCELCFTFFYIGKPNMLEFLKLNLAGFKTKRIFDQNIKNIKRIVETGA